MVYVLVLRVITNWRSHPLPRPSFVPSGEQHYAKLAKCPHVAVHPCLFPLWSSPFNYVSCTVCCAFTNEY
jgi:hypothetical protein